jgi:aarF domain-containing kinase
VLLDHGLYRSLDNDFRKNYTRLWQALVLGDLQGIEVMCKKLNAG